MSLAKPPGVRAQQIVRLAHAVERELDRDHAVCARAQDAFGLRGDQLGQQAVGGQQHDRRPVARVENPADFDDIFSQINLAAGEGKPQQVPERACHPLDLGERQLRRRRRGRRRAREVEAERTSARCTCG